MFGKTSGSGDTPLEKNSNSRGEKADKASDQMWVGGILVLSCVFLYLQVFMLPSTPRLASGDQAIYLHDAARMLQGELIYRDYDQFIFPGTDLLYVTLFKIFGVRAWIPQVMLLFLGTSLAWLATVLSRKVIRGKNSFLPSLLFLALPFSGYLDATHHWFSMLADVGVVVVLIERRSRTRLAVSGALLGVATFFTQSSVMLTIGIGLFLLWEERRQCRHWNSLLEKESVLMGSYFTTVAASLTYFVWAVGVRRFFYYTVTFVVKYYPADWFNNWRVYLSGRPHLHVWTSWVDLPAFVLIHLTVPSIYIIFSIYASRSMRSDPMLPRLMLINVAGGFVFLSIVSAPAYNRLYVVSLPALILLVWLLNSLVKVRALVLSVLWATVVALLIARPLVTQLRWKAYLDLPTGRTAFLEPVMYEKCQWMSERTRPLDYFFGDHLIAFALRLRNVSRVPFVRPTDYTRPEEVQSTIEGLEKYRVRFVAWFNGLSGPEKNGRQSAGDHLGPLRLYLHGHYHVVRTFSNGDQIWQRNP